MNNSIMRHKGYSASIRYGEEDGFLVGRIPGINDVASFHGHGVEEIRKQFVVALDSYLSDRKEIGKDPERSYSGRLNLRLSPELHRQIAMASETRGKSINDIILDALQESGAVRDAAKPMRKLAAKRLKAKASVGK